MARKYFEGIANVRHFDYFCRTMKIVLKEHNEKNIKRVRHVARRGSLRQNLTLRGGVLYTMKYNPGVQPRTERQEKSWSLFKEANRLATEDFHDEEKREYWKRKVKSQTRYKTARGLAKAYYIDLLKRRMADVRQNVESATKRAVSVLRPIVGDMSAQYRTNVPARQIRTWSHYRNITWYRDMLKSRVLNHNILCDT